MNVTRQKILAGLERAFAEDGFAEPSVSDLRDAAGVSLRTLYRHFPSRDEMVIGALEYRHQRYLSFLFDDLPTGQNKRLDAIFDRIDSWMSTNSPQGCIFQNALAAHPHSPELGNLLLEHKRDIGHRLAESIGLSDRAAEMRQIHEGGIQSWVFQREEAIKIARMQARALLDRGSN